jgi:hypothetical protein
LKGEGREQGRRGRACGGWGCLKKLGERLHGEGEGGPAEHMAPWPCLVAIGKTTILQKTPCTFSDSSFLPLLPNKDKIFPPQINPNFGVTLWIIVICLDAPLV